MFHLRAPLGPKPFRESTSRNSTMPNKNNWCPRTREFPAVFPPNFEVYEGLWKDGKRHGYGVQRYGVGTSSVSSYNGEWQENVRHGRGIMTYASGNKYEGYWVKVWMSRYLTSDWSTYRPKTRLCRKSLKPPSAFEL